MADRRWSRAHRTGGVGPADLRRLRRRLTLLYSAISALAIGAISVLAIDLGTTAIHAAAERDVERAVADLLFADFGALADEDDLDDTWLVFPPDVDLVAFGEELFGGEPLDDAMLEPIAEPLGATSVEPPLQTLFEQAIDGPVYLRFSVDGERWLAHARFLPEEDAAVVAATPLADADADAASLRLQVALSALAAVVLASGLGWLIAGRSLRPAATALEQQRTFIADAAHELRTPLTVIRASSSHALSTSDRSAEDYRISLTEVHDAAARATDSVAGLLQLARLDAGEGAAEREAVRLDLLVEEVAADSTGRGAVVRALPAPPLVVDADPGLLRTAVTNLVDNATTRASVVELSVAPDDRAAGWVRIEVSDDGPGFGQHLLAHAFERFRRGDEQGGAGLGLAIVRAVVDAHGGTCEAADRPDGGAVVRLRLPPR